MSIVLATPGTSWRGLGGLWGISFWPHWNWTPSTAFGACEHPEVKWYPQSTSEPWGWIYRQLHSHRWENCYTGEQTTHVASIGIGNISLFLYPGSAPQLTCSYVAVRCARKNTIEHRCWSPLTMIRRPCFSHSNSQCFSHSNKSKTPRCVSGITAKLFERKFSKNTAIAEAWAASVIAKSNLVRAVSVIGSFFQRIETWRQSA